MFKERIRELINEYCDGSQKILSQQTKIPYSTINSWFNKNTLPGYEQIILLCDALKTSSDYLLGREDDFGNIELPAAEQLPADERELLSLYRSFSNDMKKSVLDTLKSMKSTFGFVEKRG